MPDYFVGVGLIVTCLLERVYKKCLSVTSLLFTVFVIISFVM